MPVHQSDVDEALVGPVVVQDQHWHVQVARLVDQRQQEAVELQPVGGVGHDHEALGQTETDGAYGRDTL